MSDPTVPCWSTIRSCSASLQTTDQIASQIIDTTRARGDRRGRGPGRGGSAPPRSATPRSSLGAILLALLARHPGGAVAGPAAAHGCATAPCEVAHDDLAREIDRVRSGERARTRRADPGAHHRGGRPGRARRRRTARAGRPAGRRAVPAAAAGRATCSRRCRGAAARWSTSSCRSSTGWSATRRTPSGWRACSGSITSPPGCAATAPTCWCSRARKVPREQAEPVPVSALINAAASEVEDYTRVVTATVPDSEIVGSVAGDLVHLLAELLDNALRYSPPISQVRVSAVHTGNGGLVIEVSDIGLGMTESDLRVANTRLQSGGEVNPYTARHMGLFVVGRLAAAARAGGPVAQHHCGRTEFGHHRRGVRALGAARARRRARPVRHRSHGHARRRARGHRDRPGARRGRTTTRLRRRRLRRRGRRDQLNGHSEVPVALLPQRNPGASGISDISDLRAARAGDRGRLAAEDVAGDSMPRRRRAYRGRAASPSSRPAGPVDTSAFFASRAQASPATVPTRIDGRSRARSPSRNRRSPSRPTRGTTVDDGRRRRRDLPEDAVRVARRSHRPGQQQRPELGVGLGPRLVGGRGGGGSAGRRSTPRRGCRCASPAPGWCRVRPRSAGRRPPTAVARQRRSAPQRRRRRRGSIGG